MIKGMHLTPIGDGKVLLEPGEGLDPSDPDAYLVPLAEALQRLHAERLLYDLKNVALIDPLYYDWLLAVNGLCRISGVELVTINMRPATAYALATRLRESPPFTCALDVNGAG